MTPSFLHVKLSEWNVPFTKTWKIKATADLEQEQRKTKG